MKRNGKCQLGVGENKDIVLFPVTVHKRLIPTLGPWLTTSAPESGLLAGQGWVLCAFPVLQVMPGVDRADELTVASSQFAE